MEKSLPKRSSNSSNENREISLEREHSMGKARQGAKVYHDFYKTKICPLFKLGSCYRGEECTFAHSEDDLREMPNLAKTKICENFLKGSCREGMRCRFAHGEHELRSTPDLFKTAICFSWAQGRCIAGDRCRFAHGEEDLRPAPTHEKFKKKQFHQHFSKNNQRSNMSAVLPTHIPPPMPYSYYQGYPPVPEGYYPETVLRPMYPGYPTIVMSYAPDGYSRHVPKEEKLFRGTSE
eukprot:TRINITY_DN8415_c0_g3_i3.p1 TRINITY_DN8415_c0_g3~~TRINITY_DN8415_c0_g3_i3.p1  ORF type:complete len:235 (+),score=15.30 TRINITY_DN8415_c0_g3_i3:100-804(+)